MAPENLITPEQMFPLLLEADPSFEPTWREFLDEWEGDEKGLPWTLATSDLARHLIAKLERGDTRRFDAVFDVVERWHLQGDKSVKNIATVGLLEDLQNTGLYDKSKPQPAKPADFEAWLRPDSKRWWDKVERFWSHGEIIKDD